MHCMMPIHIETANDLLLTNHNHRNNVMELNRSSKTRSISVKEKSKSLARDPAVS
uniref:Uncharacterized protein n=1 Tax=Arundo donax TaxID=35708 RepID=A0A0A9HIR6_ARUDO